MILADLRAMKGCPQAGLTVTVYGSHPWNCWVHYGAAGGPLYNKPNYARKNNLRTLPI
jgi:hypothetical protein